MVKSGVKENILAPRSLTAQSGANRFYGQYVKRALDIALASISILLLSPVLLIVAVLIRMKLGSPIIFKQQRPGLNEKVFMLYKFRTMTDKRNSHGDLLPDEIRLTSFGKFLRSTSLDELPELWNIIRGDMSFIGPRPLLVQYLPLYDQHQKRRHEIRPGLSGLAQVSGRNALSWESKFKLDVEYVDNITFFKDIQIILLTLKKVFVREGINSETSATVEVFRGSETEHNERTGS